MSPATSDGIRSLYDYYSMVCERYKTSMLFDNVLTHGQVLDMVKSRAAWLQSQGFVKDDVIALVSPDSREWCITYMAVTSIGSIILPLDINYPDGTYDQMLDTAGTKAVFVSDGLKTKIHSHMILDISMDQNMGDPNHFTRVHVTAGDTASLVYTSGTTGNPKIVMLTHGNIIKTSIACADFVGISPKDCTLCLLPLFHAYALIGSFLGPFANGSAFCIQPSLKGADILKSLKEFPISFFPATPQLWELMFDAISSRVKNGSAARYRFFMFLARNGYILRFAGLGFLVNRIFKPVRDAFSIDNHLCFVSGGAALKKQYARYYRSMGFRLIEGYGLSETTGPICVDNRRHIRIGSVGRPLPGNEAVIRDINEDGIGELWVRGDAVSPGYYMNPAATKEVFSADGFFNTGDLGRIDRKGFIYLTGRSKNVIVLDSGKNVYPEEMEAYYRQSQLIREIAVLGRKNDGRMTVFAVIVPGEKKSESFSIIREELNRLNASLPDYKKVNSFALSWDSLPVNTIRKTLYREVENLLNEGAYQTEENGSAQLRTELTANDTRQEMIINLLKKKFNHTILYARQTLSDFNIDSLGFLDLIVYLEEELSISIETEEMRALSTLDEIVAFIEGCKENTGLSMEERIFRNEITTKPYRFFTPMLHLALDIVMLVNRMLWDVRLANNREFTFENSILVANHESYLDMMWIGLCVPRKLRSEIYVIGKKKLKFLKYILPFIPVVFLEQENPYPSLKAGADLLRQGKSLVIFPEGTRCTDGELGEFKTGAAYLAKNLNKKVLPMTINGAYEIYPRHRLLPRFFTSRKGSIKLGEPIDPALYNSPEELNMAIKDAIASNLE